MQTIQINSGDLLVASREMNDIYFKNSVILITAINAHAVVGFIINRMATMPVNELFDTLDDFYKTFKRRIFIGGPVEENSLHLVALANSGGKEVVPGVRMGGRWNNIEEMLISDERENRLTLGYTAWGVEQLQNEIRGGSWYVYKNMPIADVFFEIDAGNMPTSESAVSILGEYVKI